MFVGREDELHALECLFASKCFEMAVVYGRRRIGKTALLAEFAHDKRTLFFTAQQKSNVLNLRAFSRAIGDFLGTQELGTFESWLDALTYLARQCATLGEPSVIVFDELPYAAQADPSLPSALQIAIDHDFKETRSLLVLCGSNEGFMESEVLGEKSPLYGRRTAQIHLQPFDYLDAALLMPPSASCDELVAYYAALGGTPYYLEQIDHELSFGENVSRLFFDLSGILYAEPLMLLRQELREPASYVSVLDAVASGATSPKVIAEHAGMEERAVSVYLGTLCDLGIIQRALPFGASKLRSRKGIYRIRDPFFAFWYRFVSPTAGLVESGAGHLAARQALGGQSLSTYVGHQFETICLQWLMRQNRNETLPFLALSFGSWWGTDPQAHERADIDIIAANKPSRNLLVGECKWRESFDESATLATLERRAQALKEFDRTFYALFSKRAPSEGTRAEARSRDDLLLVSCDELYAR